MTACKRPLRLPDESLYREITNADEGRYHLEIDYDSLQGRQRFFYWGDGRYHDGVDIEACCFDNVDKMEAWAQDWYERSTARRNFPWQEQFEPEAIAMTNRWRVIPVKQRRMIGGRAYDVLTEFRSYSSLCEKYRSIHPHSIRIFLRRVRDHSVLFEMNFGCGEIDAAVECREQILEQLPLYVMEDKL